MNDFKPDLAAFNMGDFHKLMEQSKIQTVDWTAIMDMSRKNAQMLATIQQVGLEAWQDMMSMSQKVASDFAAEQAKLASSAVAEGSPEAKIAKATEALHDTYDKVHRRYREMADLQYKLAQDMSALISRRIKANLKELQETIEK